MPTMRDNSRQDWRGDASSESIKLGSIQRIADACELMAKNYVAMQSEVAYYKRIYKEAIERCGRLERSNAALRGVITKFKKLSES